MFKKEAIRENEIIYQLIFPVKPFYPIPMKYIWTASANADKS